MKYFVTINIIINNHSEVANLFVTQLGQYPIILGYGWLARHGPIVDWSKNSIRFVSQYCIKNCLPKKNSTLDCNKVDGLNTKSLSSYLTPRLEQNHMNTMAVSHELFPSNGSRQSAVAGFNNHASNQKLVDIEFEELKLQLPDWLHHQIPSFSKLESRELPPHRSIDHKIVLKEGAQLPSGRLYSMSREELVTLREWLQDNLSKGFIRPSSSPAASPVLFVKKSDGKLRLCMDYRALNALTVKNRYPIPLISETLDRLSKAQYFTKSMLSQPLTESE